MTTNLKVEHNSLLETVVPFAAAKSQRWREGFRRLIAAYNATAGQALSIAYGLLDEVVSNNSQRARIMQAEEYLAEFEGKEKAEGYLTGWLQLHREDYGQVVSGQAEGMQASPELRSAMYQLFRDGKLD